MKMHRQWMMGLACCLTLAFTACGEPIGQGDLPTKDEVRKKGKSDDNTDWCDEFDWYGDGVCDDFCLNPDPDCSCAESPVAACEFGEVEIDEQTCSVAGDDCRTTELCGETAYCLYVGEACPSVVGTPAACPSNTEEVDACVSEDCVIARGDGDQCGDVAFCEPTDDEPPVNCLAIATCQAGEVEIDEQTCLALDDECITHELCGTTAYCVSVGEDCPQVVGTPAECPAGTTEVDTCTSSECEVARGTGDQCNDVAFCEPTGPDICEAIATCQAGEIEIDAQTCLAVGDECVTHEICGTTAHCLFVGEACPQVVGTPAECPQGTVEVDTCTSSECEVARGTGDQCTDVAFCQVMEACLAIPTCDLNQHNVSSEECLRRGDACESKTVCGETLHCVDSPMICPQVVGTPPSCPAGKSEVSGCSTQGLDSGDCELVFGTGDQCGSFIYCR